jgi:uncharacterized protein YuzE
MQLEYDLSVGALYIRLGDQPVVGTREVDSNTSVDLAEDGTVVGIEVISITHRWALPAILANCLIPDGERRQLCAYFGPPQEIAVPATVLPYPPQLTSGSEDLPVERTPVLTTV